MGKYYTIKQSISKDKSYEVHGDVIIPLGRESFDQNDLEKALKALTRIAREKGIGRKVYFEKSS